MDLSPLLPLWFELTSFFILGLIIGSFLNVFIYRFHTGKSLSGHSHCLSCAARLRVIDLVPLFSYLGLLGRCARCKAVIPPRYFLVELLTGLLFVTAYLSATDLVVLALLSVFVSVLVVTAVYDLYHFIIPDEFVITLALIALLYQGYLLSLGGSLTTFFTTLAVSLVGSMFLFSLWYFSKGTWIGFGDVKLAVPLGIMVGMTGIFSMIVLSFWSGAIIGLGMLLIEYLRRRGQAHLRFIPSRFTIKSAVPFAPFLILGFLQVFFFGTDVIALVSYAY